MKFRTMKMGMLAAVTVLVGTVNTAFAQTIAITNAKLYTMQENQQQAQTGTIIIRNGDIVNMGANLAIPAGATQIDAKNGSVTPGLFNADSHLGVEEVSAVDQTVDTQTSVPDITASLRVADAFNFRSTVLHHNRSQGLTHALVLPVSGSSIISGQGALINLSATSDSVLDDYAALFINYGEAGQALAGGSRAAALVQLRTALRDARDFATHTPEFNSGARRAYSLSHQDLLGLAPIVQHQAPVIISASRAADILTLLKFAKQESIQLIIAGAEEGWLVAEQLAEAQVPVIIDPIENLPTRYESASARADNAALLDAAGVTVLFTGMGWQRTHNAYLVRQSAGNAVANGMNKMAALKAMTANPGKVFKVRNYSGTLRVGEKANLVVWSGDPLEVTSEPVAVFIDGQSQDLTTRASLLAKRYYDKIKAAK